MMQSRTSELVDQVGQKTPRNKAWEEKVAQVNEEGLRELQGNMKHNDIYTLEIPEEEGEEPAIVNLFQTLMRANFLLDEPNNSYMAGNTVGLKEVHV